MGAGQARRRAQGSGRRAGRAAGRSAVRVPGRAAGARGAGARGALARQQAHERAECALHRRGARGLCTQAGPVGPVGCSCTRLGFQPGFSTRYFS